MNEKAKSKKWRNLACENFCLTYEKAILIFSVQKGFVIFLKPFTWLVSHFNYEPQFPRSQLQKWSSIACQCRRTGGWKASSTAHSCALDVNSKTLLCFWISLYISLFMHFYPFLQFHFLYDCWKDWDPFLCGTTDYWVVIWSCGVLHILWIWPIKAPISHHHCHDCLLEYLNLISGYQITK